MNLADLFREAEFAQAADEGLISARPHPSEPLVIYNYTKECQHRGIWNECTRQCRGLITTYDGEVVARPFPKFFNYGEPNAPELEFDAPARVTDKMDGCLLGSMTLNVWGGGTVKIGDIVRDRLRVTLVGANEHGDLVPTEVVDWHDNGTKDSWVDITVDCCVSRISGTGRHPNRLRLTANHHVLREDGTYRAAQDLAPGDICVTRGWEPSEEAMRLVRASLLGDGCLTPSPTKPQQAKYQEAHTASAADYVAALRAALGDCGTHRSDTVSGHGSTMLWAGSREYVALGDLRREWYPNGEKRVPDDLSWLDDFSVAKWYMDDGSLAHSDLQRDRALFHPNAHRRDEVERLASHLRQQYGVSATVYESAGWNIRLNAGRDDALEHFWMRIAPHVHPAMRYKLPERHRSVAYQEIPVGREIVVARPVTVLHVQGVEPSKRNFPSGRRGLDVTTTTGNYMARGVIVHNSLGILYPCASGVPDKYHAGAAWAIATRGSFESEQALVGTEILKRYLDGSWLPLHGLTYLFEIIYPENRIVVDYGDVRDLFLLAVIDNQTGTNLGTDTAWPGPKTEVFEYASLAEALTATPRPNREGLVVEMGGTRIKIKQEDYVALHRIVTGLNERVVWEQIGAGATFAEIIEPLPEEFHGWIKDVSTDLCIRAGKIESEARTTFTGIQNVLTELGSDWTRKDFALEAQKPAYAEIRPYLFLLLDGKEIRSAIWKTVRPAGNLAPRDFVEDA